MEGPQTSTDAECPMAPGTSLTARLTNVFVSPSEVFDEVKASPPTPANWIVPLALAIVAGIIYSMVVFAQPAVIQHMKDAQEAAMHQKVTAGKMTQQQADQGLEFIQKYMTPSILKVTGILFSIFGTALMLFIFASVVWLVGRLGFQGQFPYMKAVEATGLATMIGALGGIVSMLTAVIYGDTAMTPGPILLVGHVDPNNKLHLLLSALSLMTLWNLAVVGIGLARLSGAGIVKSVLCVIGLWYGIWSFFVLVLPMLFGGK